MTDMISQDHNKIFDETFQFIGAYLNKKSFFDEHNVPIGEGIDAFMIKVEEARATAEITLEQMNRLHCHQNDIERVEKATKALQMKKVDVMELEKTKVLSLYYNFQTQQRHALKHVTSSRDMMKDDLLVPYVHKQRNSEIINSSRGDNARNY